LIKILSGYIGRAGGTEALHKICVGSIEELTTKTQTVEKGTALSTTDAHYKDIVSVLNQIGIVIKVVAEQWRIMF